MPLILTVLGPVEAASLGRTLMHEHIFILTAARILAGPVSP